MKIACVPREMGLEGLGLISLMFFLGKLWDCVGRLIGENCLHLAFDVAITAFEGALEVKSFGRH